MDKINMINMQPILLQEKFRKKKQKSFSLSRLLVVSFIIIFTTSLFFLNVESQELNSSSEISPGSFTRSISFE